MGHVFGRVRGGWLVLAVAVSFLLMAFRTWRWQLELRPLEHIPFGRLWVVTAVAYLAINLFPARLGEVVRPWLLSRRIVISPVAIFLTVATLVWMWGPAASITAVPLLISVHTVALHVPSLRGLAMLLATEDGSVVKRNAGLRREPRRLWHRRSRPTSS